VNLFRRVVFYFLFLLYLVLCPLIIFYALGYIFTPKLEEGFAKTGLIRVETLPSGASVWIANKRFSEKTPATIRNLLAGDYDIRISLAGHRPWIRRITVEPGKAASFSHVLLVPRKLDPRPLITGPFTGLYPVPGTRFLLLKGSELAGDLRAFDWKNETVSWVFPKPFPFANAKLVRIFTANESPFILVQIEHAGGMKFLGYSLDKDKSEAQDLSGLFKERAPDEILWEGAKPDYLFVRYDRNVSRIDLEKMKVLPGFFQNVRGVGIFKGKIYALSGPSIVRTNFNAKPGDETFVESGAFLEDLFREDGKFKIDFISHNTICISSEKGEFFSNALPYRFVEEGVRGYHAAPEGRKVVLWQERRVGILDLEKPERKKEFFERGPEIKWVFDRAADVRDAYFVYDAAYILFSDRGEVFLAPVKEEGSSAEKPIKICEGAAIFYSEKTGALYYLEPSQGHFMALQLLPEGIKLSRLITELEKETQEMMK